MAVTVAVVKANNRHLLHIQVLMPQLQVHLIQVAAGEVLVDIIQNTANLEMVAAG